MPVNNISLDVRDIKNFEYDADKCTGCKGCVWVDHIYMPPDPRFSSRCPSYSRYLFDVYGAYGRKKVIMAMMEGRMGYTPTTMDVIYRCQLCGACDAGCKRNLEMETLLTLEAWRIKCVQDGKGPLPEHKKIIDNMADTDNRYGAPHKDRLKWLPADIELSARPDVIYFAGCSASYIHPEIATATAKILKKAGVEFTVMQEEHCCGCPAYSAGDIEAAQKQAEHNIDAISKSGAGTVITSCAECYKTLKVDYPKMLGKSTSDMGYKILHLVEFVAEQVKDGKLDFTGPVDLKVAYHDSCHLARLSEPWTHWEGKREKMGVLNPEKNLRRGTYGVYQPPRDILNAIPGLEMVEMLRMKENALCCGSGGGVRDAYKDFASFTANNRLEEVKEIGAEAIVSACPFCKDSFKAAIEDDKTKMEVYDISELIIRALS